MLYNLLYPLADLFSPFNLFRYLTFRSAAAFLTALVLSFVIGAALIRWLRSKQGRASRSATTARKPPRQEGHADHGRAADPDRADGRRRCCGRTSPTAMSGSCCSSPSASALIGFCDDYLKVTKRNHQGRAGQDQAAARSARSPASRPG